MTCLHRFLLLFDRFDDYQEPNTQYITDHDLPFAVNIKLPHSHNEIKFSFMVYLHILFYHCFTNRRTLSKQHLQKHGWLTYSASKEGFFCKYFVLFAPTSVGAVKCSQTAGKLVRTQLTMFNKLTGKDGVLTNHEQSTFHKSSIEASQNFKLTCSNPSVDIRNQLSKQRDDQVSIKWLSNIF